MGALGLGKGPEVASGTGKEKWEGKLELTKALTSHRACVAIGAMVRTVCDGEEDLSKGVDKMGEGRVDGSNGDGGDGNQSLLFEGRVAGVLEEE